MNVLIVEDDLKVRRILRDAFEGAGATAQEASSVSQMRARLKHGAFDLVTLDISLPDEDGISALRWVRRTSADLPVIMITGRADLPDVVHGLDEGADDYVTKPFRTDEVVARARAVRRRRAKADEVRPATRIAFDGYTVDVTRREVLTPEGSLLRLTGGEFDLLTTFLEKPNVPLSRDALRAALGMAIGAYDDRALDMKVRRLRAKLEPEPEDPRYIKTLRGRGYLFAAPVSPG